LQRRLHKEALILNHGNETLEEDGPREEDRPIRKKKTDPEKKTHNNESMQSEIQKEKQMVQHLEWMNCTPKRLE
jgi:hypothetical protein